MRARRLLILLMMLLLLLPQAQAERLTLYTRPNNVDEAMPFQLRPTELSICSVTRAMGGVVVVQKAPKDIKRMLSIAGIESKD